MSQTPITISYSLEEVLKKINGNLETLQKDVSDLKIGQVRLEEEIKGVKEQVIMVKEQIKGVKDDVKELKGSSQAQIWTLIGILITAVAGFLVAVGRFVIAGNP